VSIPVPCPNLTDDPYFTDGPRALLWASSQMVAFEDVQFVEWAIPGK